MGSNRPGRDNRAVVSPLIFLLGRFNALQVVYRERTHLKRDQAPQFTFSRVNQVDEVGKLAVYVKPNA